MPDGAARFLAAPDALVAENLPDVELAIYLAWAGAADPGFFERAARAAVGALRPAVTPAGIARAAAAIHRSHRSLWLPGLPTWGRATERQRQIATLAAEAAMRAAFQHRGGRP